MSATFNKPLTWGDLDAPPVWGHGCNGETIHKPDYDEHGNMVRRSATVEQVAEKATSSMEHEFAPSGIEIRVKSIEPKAVVAEAIAPTETVYECPEPGTVFDESNFSGKRPDTSVARAAVTAQIQRRAGWFLVTAALNGYEYFEFSGNNSVLAAIAGITAVVFLVMAGLAFKLNRMAFLVAIGFYALGTLALVGVLMSSQLPLLFFAKPLVARCFLIYRHYRNYGLLTDLKLLEES